MKMLHCLTVVLPAVLALGPFVCAQKAESKPQDPKASSAQGKSPQGDPYQAMLKLFAKNGITFDMKQKTVTVDCVMGRPDQALEFLLVHRKGKDHESLLVTKAKASTLNAALLLIGLVPGKNARVEQKDPLPTIEEVKAGARVVDVFAPEGQPMYMTAKWQYEVTDEESGKTKIVKDEAVISDMIRNEMTEKAVADDTWIFLGGMMGALYRGEEPVFLGDYQGNLVSIVYKQPKSHLITMSHEFASDEQVWWYTDICPPPSTPIKLTFHFAKPELEVLREARLKKEDAAAKKAAAKKAAAKGEGVDETGKGGSGKGAGAKK